MRCVFLQRDQQLGEVCGKLACIRSAAAKQLVYKGCNGKYKTGNQQRIYNVRSACPYCVNDKCDDENKPYTAKETGYKKGNGNKPCV